MDTIESGEDIENIVIKKDNKDVVRRKIADFKRLLNERERFILDNRIMAEDPLTLEEIGERFEVTRERARQIQVKLSRRLERRLEAIR